MPTEVTPKQKMQLYIFFVSHSSQTHREATWQTVYCK